MLLLGNNLLRLPFGADRVRQGTGPVPQGIGTKQTSATNTT